MTVALEYFKLLSIKKMGGYRWYYISGVIG